jgi:hypothetical protein
VSFLFPTQEFWLFFWIPGFLRAKTQASLTQLPTQNDKEPNRYRGRQGLLLLYHTRYVSPSRQIKRPSIGAGVSLR